MKKITLLTSLLLCLCLLLGGCSIRNDVPDAPPVLKLTLDGNVFEISCGPHSWNTKNTAGKGESTIACGAHPLDGQYDPIETSAEDALVGFDLLPTTYEIYCWPESELGNTSAEPTVFLPHHDRFPIQEGGWIYQLKANWQGNGYSGDAEYVFCIIRSN